MARASVAYWCAVGGMIAAIVGAGLWMHALARTSSSSPDARFATHFAQGAAMPFPVIMDDERGWAFLAIFFALIAALATLSLLASRALGSTGRRGPALLIFGLIGVVAVMTAFPVTFSLDAYAYAAFGRLLGVDRVNPYLEHLASGSTLGDPVLAALTAFLGTPLPDENYGPLWTLFAGALAFVTKGGGVAAAVWAQHAAGAAALVVAAAGVMRVTWAHTTQSEAARRTALFALHPAVVYESAAAGHNDMLMVAPAVWALALVDDAPIAAGVLAGVAIAVKYVALLVVPFLIVRAYRLRGSGMAAWVALASLFVPAVLFVPLWPGFSAFASFLDLRANLIMSPLWLAQMWIADPALSRIAQTVATLAAVAVVAYSIARYARKPHVWHVLRSVAAVLFASPLLNPWYVQWLAPGAAAAGRWARFAWWFALLAPLRYVEDALRYPAAAADLASRIALLEWLTVAIFVLPLALAFLPRLPFQRVADGDA
jgi:hypothetical protein